MPLGLSFGTYLGIPSNFGSSKKEIFRGVVARVGERLTSWTNLFLNSMGRLALIHSVISSLATHVFLVF